MIDGMEMLEVQDDEFLPVSLQEVANSQSDFRERRTVKRVDKEQLRRVKFLPIRLRLIYFRCSSQVKITDAM